MLLQATKDACTPALCKDLHFANLPPPLEHPKPVDHLMDKEGVRQEAREQISDRGASKVKLHSFPQGQKAFGASHRFTLEV